MRLLYLLFTLLCFSQFTTDHLQVNASKIIQGNHLKIILEFLPAQNFHLYWWNPGDSGESIKFIVELDEEPLVTYPILLSGPKEIKKEIITNYILEGRFLAVLSFDFKNLPNSGLINLDYLICSDTCIPEQLSIKFNLESLPNYENTEEVNQLDFTSTLPADLSILTLESSLQIRSLESSIKFFPYDLPPSAIYQETPNSVRISSEKPNGLLFVSDTAKFYKIGNFYVYPSVSYQKDNVLSFLYSVLLAILAGVILNFMPCVLPVLALKSLKPSASYIFVAGATLTITVMGILVSGAVEGIKNLGWGFQLQNKIFVFWINFLLFSLTLNFLKVFNIPFFGYAISVNSSSKFFDFFFGIGISLLALPCGAPFLVTLLISSSERSFLQNLLVFIILGLSFSLFFPLTLKFTALKKLTNLIRSNMETSIKILSLPLALTIFWLLWILENQGVSPSLSLVAYLLLGTGVSLLFSRRLIFSALLIFVGGYFASISLKNTESQGISEYGVVWDNYSEDLLKQLRDEGVPYYLDFTAEWCVTCKVNKYLVFSDRELINELKNLKFRFVKADWTNGEQRVTQGLMKRGAKAVPFTVIYIPNKGEVILPTLLTPSIVRKVLSED